MTSATDLKRLMVNGCSYMWFYGQGQGHTDLADQLGLQAARPLAMPGSCNQRILRTTLQDIYEQPDATLYVIGLTFLSRFELATKKYPDRVEGHWQSFNHNNYDTRLDTCYDHVSAEDFCAFSELHARFFNARDTMHALMYQLLSLVDTVEHRGHRVVIFNTAETAFSDFIQDARFDLLRHNKAFVQGLAWTSVTYQFEQGARWHEMDADLSWDCRHVAPGEHQHLNRFLHDYLIANNILT